MVWLSLPVASGIAAETQFAGWCLSLAFTHCRKLMKSVGELWWLSHYYTYYWRSLNRCETGTVHTGVCFLFFVSPVFPCLVLSMASWGSVNLAVFSSSWEWRFLYSYERYYCIRCRLVSNPAFCTTDTNKFADCNKCSVRVWHIFGDAAWCWAACNPWEQCQCRKPKIGLLLLQWCGGSPRCMCLSAIFCPLALNSILIVVEWLEDLQWAYMRANYLVT